MARLKIELFFWYLCLSFSILRKIEGVTYHDGSISNHLSGNKKYLSNYDDDDDAGQDIYSDSVTDSEHYFTAQKTNDNTEVSTNHSLRSLSSVYGNQEKSIQVFTVLKSSAPILNPAELVLRTLDNSNTIQVVKTETETFWAYSYRDGRFAFLIVSFDNNNEVVRMFYRPGARYLQSIRIEYDSERVVFTGEFRRVVILSFDEIFMTPSLSPSSFPSTIPSSAPSVILSSHPSQYPTISLSSLPSSRPSYSPSSIYTLQPSLSSSIAPSFRISSNPSLVTSNSPSYFPTLQPSTASSALPSSSPTLYPTINNSLMPSIIISSEPTSIPTEYPTISSTTPSSFPSLTLSSYPTLHPTTIPSPLPTFNLLFSSTAQPSLSSFSVPSFKGNSNSSLLPTLLPSATPSVLPSSNNPTQYSTINISLISNTMPINDSVHNSTDLSLAKPPSTPVSLNPSFKSPSPSPIPTTHSIIPPSLSPMNKFPFLKTLMPSVVNSSSSFSPPSSLPSSISTYEPSHIPSSEITVFPSTSTYEPSHIPSSRMTVFPSSKLSLKNESFTQTFQPSTIVSRIPTLKPTSLHSPSSLPIQNNETSHNYPSMSPSENTSFPITYSSISPSSQPEGQAMRIVMKERDVVTPHMYHEMKVYLLHAVMMPVLIAGGLEFWAYSYNDNHEAMYIVAFDENRDIVKTFYRSGVANLTSIEIDYENEIVYFIGENEKSVMLSFAEIYSSNVPSSYPSPVATYMPSSTLTATPTYTPNITYTSVFVEISFKVDGLSREIPEKEIKETLEIVLTDLFNQDSGDRMLVIVYDLPGKNRILGDTARDYGDVTINITAISFISDTAVQCQFKANTEVACDGRCSSEDIHSFKSQFIDRKLDQLTGAIEDGTFDDMMKEVVSQNWGGIDAEVSYLEQEQDLPMAVNTPTARIALMTGAAFGCLLFIGVAFSLLIRLRKQQEEKTNQWKIRGSNEDIVIDSESDMIPNEIDFSEPVFNNESIRSNETIEKFHSLSEYSGTNSLVIPYTDVKRIIGGAVGIKGGGK